MCGMPCSVARQVTGGVGVPGVRVHEIGARDVARDLQVHSEGSERRVRAGETGGHEVGVHILLFARQTEAAHRDLEVRAQSANQLGDVHSSPAVDLRRVLAGDDPLHALQRR